jgi:hypothetical protein
MLLKRTEILSMSIALPRWLEPLAKTDVRKVQQLLVGFVQEELQRPDQGQQVKIKRVSNDQRTVQIIPVRIKQAEVLRKNLHYKQE